MTRFTQTFTLRPPNQLERWAYRRRGCRLPLACQRTPLVRLLLLALPPGRFRRLQHTYATSHGYYWMPCPICGNEYGGHDAGGTTNDRDIPMLGHSICRPCTLAGKADE